MEAMHRELGSGRGLRLLGGGAAWIGAALLLLAVPNLFAAAGFLNNWLTALFQLNAGFIGIRADRLQGIHPLDLAILALAAAMQLGLFAVLRRTSRVGAALALVQPFLGIALFAATGTAGRSSVMGAALVGSVVMLFGTAFGKPTAVAGILAAVLLLVGDFGTKPGSPSGLLAVLIAAGYILLIAWLFLAGRKLLAREGGTRA